MALKEEPPLSPIYNHSPAHFRLNGVVVRISLIPQLPESIPVFTLECFQEYMIQNEIHPASRGLEIRNSEIQLRNLKMSSRDCVSLTEWPLTMSSVNTRSNHFGRRSSDMDYEIYYV